MEVPSAKACSRLQQFGLERPWHFHRNIKHLYVYILYFLGPLSVPSLAGICPTRRQQKHFLSCFFVRFWLNFSPSFLPSPCSNSPRPGRRDGAGESTHCSGGGHVRCQRPEVFVSACWKHTTRVVFLVKQQKQPRTNVGQFWWVWCKARWWFQIFFIFTPICRRFPFWLIFFKWVETTNQKEMRLNPEKIDWLADDNVWPKITAFHSQEHASQSELDLPVQSLCKKGNEQRCIWGFLKWGYPKMDGL